MGFEKPPKRPAEVDQAIKSGDKAKIVALAKAGGRASAERRTQKEIHAELDREVHEEGMRQAAEARRDDLLPSED